MLLYGSIPHSGPSNAVPVTGIPCCCRYFVDANKNDEYPRIPNTPFCWTSTCAALKSPAVVDWSSTVTNWI